MKAKYCLLLTLTTGLLLMACKKEVEKIVVQEVEKNYSWTQVKQLYGTNTIVVHMGQDGESLFLQAPYFLNIITPRSTSAAYRQFKYRGTAAVGFPSDVYLRLPIAHDFIAQPVQDSLVELLRPTAPVNSSYKTYIHLRQLDSKATGIVPNEGISKLPFGAVNRNNYLLFGYHTASADTYLRFVLARISVLPAGNLQAQPTKVLLPLALPGVSGNYVRWIKAIDDYFLVNCGDAGLYKIREDGTAKRVFGYSITDTCYKWQGMVYLVEEYNKVLISTDDGETWQRYEGTPNAFTFSSYHAVGDSLVGVQHGLINHLFTLRWNGPNYSLRALKDDGLGQGEIRGLEQLGDTVYIGTTSGLFKRPLSKFFETNN